MSTKTDFLDLGFESAWVFAPLPDSAAGFVAWAQISQTQVETALDTYTAAGTQLRLGQAQGASDALLPLIEAMRYAVLGGGKRLRALLALATAQTLSPSPSIAQMPPLALRAACAVELMHAYSLVHDDMPCMDNDVLRRGKPTVHVAFGQAQALLVGDALQTLAFEVLLAPLAAAAGSAQQGGRSGILQMQQIEICRCLARASGAKGMAGGQALDLAHVGQRLDEHGLAAMHRLKTGALLHASVMMGAYSVLDMHSEQHQKSLALLSEFAQTLGLLFQVVDDILDVVADSATLGKTAGKDAQTDKPTYASLMGVAAAQSYSRQLQAQAQEQARACAVQAGIETNRTALWLGILDTVAQRSH